jgi:hypothetical protein
MEIDQEEGQGIAAWANLLIGLVFVAVGLFIFYEAFNLPRLENRRVHFTTAPGFTPMILSAVLTVLGALLTIRSLRQAAPGGFGKLLQSLVNLENARVATALGLFLLLIFGFLGHMPFWLSTGIFMFLFILLLETFISAEPIPLWRSALWALIVAVVGSASIYLLFARVFFVRLP